MKRRFEFAIVVCAVLFLMVGSARATCLGDCDDEGTVVVSELITGINIALGTADLSTCVAFDGNSSGDVTVDELVTAINNALTGCPTGGECGNGTLEAGEDCDDGNTWGGDGCAVNCTDETKYKCAMSAQAAATLQTSLFLVPIPVTGQEFLTAGKANDDSGEIPVVIRANEMEFAPVSVPGLVCACVRGGEIAEEYGPGNAAKGWIGCGTGGLAEVDYVAQIDHNTDDVDPSCENGDLEANGECVQVVGCGTFCQGGVYDRDACKDNSDCAAPHLGVCNSKRGLEFTGSGPRGSVFLRAASAISLIQDGGACAKDCTVAAMGPDCLPCTPDDCGQAAPSQLPLTSGRAEGGVLDSNNQLGKSLSSISSGTPCVAAADCTSPEKCWNSVTSKTCAAGQTGCECRRMCGSLPCVTVITGVGVDCDLLASDPNQALSGAALVGALSSVDSASLGDNVTTARFACE